MVQLVTSGIKISVKTNYEGSFFKNRVIQYSFSYTVTIENQSKDLAQLDTRFWEIHDGLNSIQTVFGEGVIGEKPILKPGEPYTYSSGCVLSSPVGAMKGYYNMINLTTTRNFKVLIPVFKLNAPFALN